MTELNKQYPPQNDCDITELNNVMYVTKDSVI